MNAVDFILAGMLAAATPMLLAALGEMVTERSVVASDGSRVDLQADTICVHGDTPGSDDLAARIRGALEAAGVAVRAIGDGAVSG